MINTSESTELMDDFHEGLRLLRELKEEFQPSGRRIPCRALHNVPWNEIISLSKEFLPEQFDEIITAMEIYLNVHRDKLRSKHVNYMLGMYRKTLAAELEKIQIKTDLAELKERFPNAFKRIE